MRTFAAAAIAITLAGCGTSIPFITKPSDTVCFDAVKSKKAWERAQKSYERVVGPTLVQCLKAGSKTEKCVSARDVDKQFRKLKVEVDFAFANPGSEIDWDEIMKILERAADAAL